MNAKFYILLLAGLLTISSIYSQNKDKKISFLDNPSIVIQQVALDGNNINAWFYSSGIFDQDLKHNDSPGFEWPKYSGSYAVFTAGLSTACYINGTLHEAMCSYKGEYEPGYVVIINGVPVPKTDSTFHIYKLKRGDNASNNPDWLNWGAMVPFGAPFIDVNHNGTYDPYVDTPGVKDAEQTGFLCMTDGFPETHQIGEGFGGGTAPLYNEVHFTAWCYNNSFLQDVQFLKWVIINKNTLPWNKTYFSITSDPDLGCALDDYIGCDTVRSLAYCYNGEPVDCAGQFRYPDVPPAVGFQWLNCSGISNLGMKSVVYFTNTANQGPPCEKDANGNPMGAYNMMKGIKSDGTPWVYPPGCNASYITKFCYSGDPETNSGWCEGNGNPSGSIWNCGGPDSLCGTYHTVNAFGDRRLVLSTGSDNLTVNPGDTQKVMIAQLIAQGTSYLNSVTKLKQLADSVKAFCNGGMVIGIKNEQTEMAHTFMVYQNYPNPFNPSTKIKYIIADDRGQISEVRLVIYDILGREVATLVKEKLQPGTYEVEWNGSNYPSGVYFYKFVVSNIDGSGQIYEQTRKMVLVK